MLQSNKIDVGKYWLLKIKCKLSFNAYKQKTKVQVFAFLSWFQNIFNHYGEADSWIKIIISKPIIIQNK
jgi:hypothetical protein